MKKIFACCAALVLAVAAWAGNGPADAPAKDNLVTRDYDYCDFTGLSVSNAFSVDLRRGNRFSIRVQVPDYLEPYLRVRVINDVLTIGLDELPRRIQQKRNADNQAMTAVVTMPRLYSLRLSGAVRLRSGDTFPSDHAAFRIHLSGSSRVDDLSVSGRGEAWVRCSGASTLSMTGRFDAWDVELTGSSSLRLAASAEALEADLSGASRAVFEGDFSDADVEMSGSAKVRINGRVTELDVDGSGASSLEAGDTQRCEVELSGAAECKVTVHDRLKVDLSGASKCRYHASKNIEVEVESVSHGATLKRL